ncbi:MAG: flavodoxin-dependent (E)-4-hydroxy-3-methylbut-2-enyl-diphosphate synthase [Coriobacteriia bacterium]|nr:flavodoxin-dependent (E)-4-hydroxy-3-methylbut-2-enyl-diphosphate synthase [Coriobacteriia bacterium]
MTAQNSRLQAAASASVSTPRLSTRQVHIGSAKAGGREPVVIGGGAPVAVQSMLNTPTTEVALCCKTIEELAELGCELIRVAVPNEEALDAFESICAQSVLPVIADIHFNHKLALEAAKRGAAKLRINPGNIGSMERVDAIIDECGARGIPIRIGVNAGSLDAEYAARTDLTQPQKLAGSASAFVEHFQARGFKDIVLSAKAHDVSTTIETYRLLAHELPEIPLHLGVTEAGTLRQGTVKSALAIGALLYEGIGDTLRVSLTAPLAEEVRVAWDILAAVGLRRRTPELISCPTCGRCQVDLQSLALAVDERLQTIKKPLAVAVMGCVVNGPGEAREADVGVACGLGKGAIFSKGEVLYTVSESEIVDALFDEIAKLD